MVCLDSFYIGKLKGVGKVYQLSAIDVFTRWAIVMIVIGPVDHTHSIRFIDHILRAYRRNGVKVRAVLTDNGPEYVDGTFGPTWWPSSSATSGSRPGRPTTTLSASGSTRPSSRSAGVPPSTGVISPRSASSKPSPTPGS